jgi:hypothetical protein
MSQHTDGDDSWSRSRNTPAGWAGAAGEAFGVGGVGPVRGEQAGPVRGAQDQPEGGRGPRLSALTRRPDHPPAVTAPLTASPHRRPSDRDVARGPKCHPGDGQGVDGVRPAVGAGAIPHVTHQLGVHAHDVIGTTKRTYVRRGDRVRRSAHLPAVPRTPDARPRGRPRRGRPRGRPGEQCDLPGTWTDDPAGRGAASVVDHRIV